MPSLQTMVDIGEMLGCSVDFLLGLEMPEENPAEAYHTAALNILEYREQMTRKQKLLRMAGELRRQLGAILHG